MNRRQRRASGQRGAGAGFGTCEHCGGVSLVGRVEHFETVLRGSGPADLAEGILAGVYRMRALVGPSVRLSLCPSCWCISAEQSEAPGSRQGVA